MFYWVLNMLPLVYERRGCFRFLRRNLRGGASEISPGGCTGRRSHVELRARGRFGNLPVTEAFDHPLTQAQSARNRRLSRIRATAEHPFLVVKRMRGQLPP